MKESWILKKLAIFSVIFICIVWVSQVSSQAEEWQHFFTNSSGDRFYYDRQSITYPSDSVVKIQSKVSNAREGTKQRELRMLMEIDCSKQMYRKLESQILNSDGTIRASSQPSGWSDIIPQSNIATLADKVCKKTIGRHHDR